MGFFASFNAWLTALLADYIGENTARIAAALEPAILSLAVLYVLVWGYVLLSGHIEEPLMDGLKRMAVIGGVIALAVHLWLYEAVIVETFFRAPEQLARAVVGDYNSVGAIDEIFYSGGDAASSLLAKGGILSVDGMAFTLAGFFVYVLVYATGIYTVFLLTLSRVALSVLLALGPLFLAMLFFRSTHRLFASWLSQLVNYALITILTVLVAALMLHIVTVSAEQAVAAGGGIQIAHAVRVCMASGLTLLIMRQVMPMAASISGGVSLVTFGAVGAAALWMASALKRSFDVFGRLASRSPTTPMPTRTPRNSLRFTGARRNPSQER
jgi:type IV secretion system protein VirB6